MEVESTVIRVPGPGGVRIMEIPSSTNPDAKHRVLLACACKGFTYRGHCHHLTQAVTKAALEPRGRRR